MMNEVTDSSLIAELEGNNSELKPIDDPALIQELEGMPQKSKGISDETLSWNIMQDYFDEPKKEVSKIWDSFVISEAFKDKGLKPNMVYDYYDTIKKSIDNNPMSSTKLLSFSDSTNQIIDKTNLLPFLMGRKKDMTTDTQTIPNIESISDDPNKMGMFETLWHGSVIKPLQNVSAGLARGYGSMMKSFGDIIGNLPEKTRQEVNAKRLKAGLPPIEEHGFKPSSFLKDVFTGWSEEMEEGARAVEPKEKDLVDKIYQGLSSSPFGIAEFTLGVPYAGIKSYAQAPEDQEVTAFAKGVLDRYLWGKVLHVVSPAPTSVRVATLGSLAASQTAIEGGTPEQIAESGAVMGILGIPGKGMNFREWRDLAFDKKIEAIAKVENKTPEIVESEINKEIVDIIPTEEKAKQPEAVKTQEAKITAEQPVKTEELQLSDLEKMFEEDKSPEEFMQMLEGKKTEAIPSEKPSELPLKEALLKEPSAMKQEAPALPEAKHEEVFSKNIDDLSIDEAKYRLTHDKLTGLKNREAFDKEEASPYMGMLDLDGFKQVNDTFGHGAGDALLKEFAKKAQEKLGDKLYRLHGDEHAFKAMSEEEGYAIAKELDNIGKSATIVVERQGTKYLMEGVEFSYGIGKDFREADAKLYEHKAVREREGSRIPGSFPEGVRFVPPTEWSGSKWSEIQDKLQREQKDLKKSHLTFLKDWLKTKEGVVKLKDSEGNIVSRTKSDREQIFQDLSKEYNYSYAQIQVLLDRAINDKPLINKPKTPASLEKAQQFIEDILAKTKDLYAKSEGDFLTSPETKTFKPKPIQQDMIGAKTGLEGKLPSEEIKGKTDLEVATEQAQIREAQKGQGDLIEASLIEEAKKYKTAEEFVKGQKDRWFDSDKLEGYWKNNSQLYAKDLFTKYTPEAYKEVGNIPIVFTRSDVNTVAGQPFLARLGVEPDTGRMTIEVNKHFPYKNDVPIELKKTIAEELEHAIDYKKNPKSFVELNQQSKKYSDYIKDSREVRARESIKIKESQLTDIWNKANEAKVEGTTPILESSGLQTLYETLMKKAKVPETAYSDLVELGKYVYDKGGKTASSWMKGMKEHLGKLWDTYKEFLTKIWNEIKKFAGNEKGFIRFGKEQQGDIKLSELDKQDELFKVGMLEAYKAGKEAYKTGIKTGVQKEHAKIMELQKQKKLHEAIKAEAKDIVNDIKDIQDNLKNTHPIASDAINKVLDSVDLSNISENKRAELEPLYAYYKSQEGMQIPENLIKPLSNLDKKPIKDLTLDELRDIHSAVMEAAKLGEKLERQEATYENVINRLSKIKPSVAVSYQKMIKETLVDFDPKKMSEQTMQELQKTKDYLDNVNPEEIGMSQETYNKLKKSTERLNKKRLVDMTLDEKKELAETLQRLNAQGKVMRQLELARRERTKQDLLKTLLDDTSTLDPKKDTTFRKGGKELYQKTLTSYRVADNIDNFIEGGMNKQFIADQLIKETESDYTAYEQNAKFIEKAKAIKPEWTEEEQQRVVVKALDVMDAKTQRDMLIEELGMKEIPILTEVENKLLLLVEETMNQNKHDISATFEYRENQIFPEIKRYIFPLKYEAQKNLVNAEILRHDYHKTKQVDDYFTEQRAKGVKKLIRTDLFNIVRQSLEEQNWYINMQPTLDTQASVLFTKDFKAKAGEMGYNWWKDQIDIVARRGYSAKSDTMFRNGEKYLKEKRINLNNAIMTYKVSSAVMQIFSVFDGMATALALQKPGAAATMIPNVIAAWLKKPEIIKMSKALQMRTGGEQALREIVDQGFKNKLTEWGYVPLKNADLRTASGVMKSFYNSLEGKGADKIQQAELLMALSQGGNAISLRPHILASGEIARTAFTFQTFFLNRWGLVANDIINRGIIHGDTKTKSYAVAALATIIAGSILEDEARDALWSLISGKKQKKEVAPVKKVLANLIETVPLAGRAMSSTIQGRRGDTDVPIVRLGKQGFGGIWDVLSKEKSKDKVKGAIKAIEMILSVRYGMPATAQIMDFIEGAMNDRK